MWNGRYLLATQLAGEALEQFRIDVQAALEACPQGWLCVGNYRHVQDLMLSQADTVLWLRLPSPCLLLAALEAHRRAGVDAAACGKATRTGSPGVRAS